MRKKVNSDSDADDEDQGDEQKEKGISNKQKKVLISRLIILSSVYYIVS